MASSFMENLRKTGDELIDAKLSLEMANSSNIEELADIKNSTCSKIANLVKSPGVCGLTVEINIKYTGTKKMKYQKREKSPKT